MRRRQLAWAVALILGSKLLQFAIDSQPLLFNDSAAFVVNALEPRIPERSYFYGWLIRLVALPFHTFRTLIAVQMAAGALTAGLLLYTAMRHCGVRYAVALGAALLFAWDPTQVVHEHLVMTEAMASLLGAVFILLLLETRSAPAAALTGLVAIALVAFRVVYIPMVWVTAAVLPWGGRRGVLAAVAIVGGQLGYQILTGHLMGREPAYHYRTGAFLLANVSPIVRPQDAVDAWAREAVRQQEQDPQHPLKDASADGRNFQLWNPGGLIARLEAAFPGGTAEPEARRIALAAIRRDPLGFLRLGVAGLAEYPSLLRDRFPWVAAIENGSWPAVQLTDNDWVLLTAHFPSQHRADTLALTAARRYHLTARAWCWLQLLSPLLGLVAMAVAAPAFRAGPATITAWATAILVVTCLATPIALRYLQPLSWPALLAVATIVESRWRR